MIDSQESNKTAIIQILQIIMVYNALVLGWKVKKINTNTFELSRRIEDAQNFDMKNLLQNIISFDLIRTFTENSNFHVFGQ